MVSNGKILCPIDFSDFSLDALRHGLVLAQWYSAQLTLFHVYQVVSTASGRRHSGGCSGLCRS